MTEDAKARYEILLKQTYLTDDEREELISLGMQAQHEVNRQGLSCLLKEGVITPDQYVRAIAEEIVNNIDEELYKNEQL